MSVEPRCKTCGVPLVQHPGMYSICRERMELFCEVERLKKEADRPRGLLKSMLESLDSVAEPDPSDETRGWNSDFGAYHRGCVLFRGALLPKEWDIIKAEMVRLFD